LQLEHAVRRLARAIERLALIEAARLVAAPYETTDDVLRLLEETEKEIGPLLRKLLDNRREASDGKRQKGG